MGRGLSDLQKWILARALACHDVHPYNGRSATWDDPGGPYGRHSRGIEITRFEVFDDWYNWPRKCGWKNGRQWEAGDCANQKYDRGVIGEKVFASAQVVVTHAFHRLERRGLLLFKGYYSTPAWTGYVLTEKGLDVARMLLVNQTPSWHPLNQ